MLKVHASLGRSLGISENVEDSLSFGTDNYPDDGQELEDNDVPMFGLSLCTREGEGRSASHTTQ